jgi:AraC-like DNA-binding protein
MTGGCQDTAQPDLEVVDVQSGESFKAWAHGYPFRTVRWHFHPEYEFHLITHTQGRAFVGDYVGAFAPLNFVMTGPNLPHNWLSDVPSGVTISERGLIVQFTADFAERCSKSFPELSFLPELLAASARGLEFTSEMGAAAEPIMRALMVAKGPARLAAFFALLDLLRRHPERRMLASVGYRPSPSTYMTQPLNHVIDHILRNLGSDLRESELAALSGFSASAFSRAFHRHTGMNFVHYVNSLRINRACEMLIAHDRKITDICYDVGFNNLSNFNRHFMAQKAMAPRDFRQHYRANILSGQSNPSSPTIAP